MEKESVPYIERKTAQTTLILYPGDKELIAWGAEYLGCAKSEFVRTAIRSYAHHLEVIAKARA